MYRYALCAAHCSLRVGTLAYGWRLAVECLVQGCKRERPCLQRLNVGDPARTDRSRTPHCRAGQGAPGARSTRAQRRRKCSPYQQLCHAHESPHRATGSACDHTSIAGAQREGLTAARGRAPHTARRPQAALLAPRRHRRGPVRSGQRDSPLAAAIPRLPARAPGQLRAVLRLGRSHGARHSPRSLPPAPVRHRRRRQPAQRQHARRSRRLAVPTQDRMPRRRTGCAWPEGGSLARSRLPAGWAVARE
jgi:hypothetical protein